MEELLIKYWDGLISCEEKQELYHLLQNDNHNYIEELRKHYRENINKKTKHNQKFGYVHKNIIIQITSQSRKIIKNTFSNNLKKISYAAALIIPILLLSIIFNQKFGSANKVTNDQIFENQNTNSNYVVKLNDNSEVTIFPEGKIIVKETFNIEDRNIYIERRGLF